MELVIVARDGVVNECTDDAVRSPEQWQPISGSLDAVVRLNRAGYRVVVTVTQAGSRGKLVDIETLNLVHQKMHQELAKMGGRFEAIFICACSSVEDCACYGPEPRLLHDIAARLRVSLEQVPVVIGDLGDVHAAQAMGARPCLVRTGAAFRDAPELEPPAGVEIHADLAGVATALLGSQDDA